MGKPTKDKIEDATETLYKALGPHGMVPATSEKEMEHSLESIQNMDEDALVNLISKIAFQMAASDAGIDPHNEDQLAEYGENSFYSLMQEHENELTNKNEEELAKLAETFLGTSESSDMGNYLDKMKDQSDSPEMDNYLDKMKDQAKAENCECDCEMCEVGHCEMCTEDCGCHALGNQEEYEKIEDSEGFTVWLKDAKPEYKWKFFIMSDENGANFMCGIEDENQEPVLIAGTNLESFEKAEALLTQEFLTQAIEQSGSAYSATPSNQGMHYSDPMVWGETKTYDDDLGVDYADEGPWRNYNLVGQGDTLQEFLEDAAIFEVDQDGGTLRDYGIEDAGGEVEKAAIEVVKSLFNVTEEQIYDAFIEEDAVAKIG